MNEYGPNGLLKAICWRPKCGQTIWIREYCLERLTQERPLLCPECWTDVYARSDMELIIQGKEDSRSESDRNEIEQEVIAKILRCKTIMHRKNATT